MSEPYGIIDAVNTARAKAIARHEMEHLVTGVEPKPEVLIDPKSFQKGRRRALEALLTDLDALPETLITKTMDEGRGAAHAASLVRPFVQRLLDDPTWIPDLENA